MKKEEASVFGIASLSLLASEHFGGRSKFRRFNSILGVKVHHYVFLLFPLSVMPALITELREVEMIIREAMMVTLRFVLCHYYMVRVANR